MYVRVCTPFKVKTLDGYILFFSGSKSYRAYFFTTQTINHIDVCGVIPFGDPSDSLKIRKGRNGPFFLGYQSTDEILITDKIRKNYLSRNSLFIHINP